MALQVHHHKGSSCQNGLSDCKLRSNVLSCKHNRDTRSGRRAVSWKLSKDNTHYLPSASYGVIAYCTLSRAAYWAMRKGRTLRYRTAGGRHLGIRHILNMKVHFEA